MQFLVLFKPNIFVSVALLLDVQCCNFEALQSAQNVLRCAEIIVASEILNISDLKVD